MTPPAPLYYVPPDSLDGVGEDTWLDVIHKMEEVYSKLVTDEVELEEKNAQLEQSQQFIFSLLSAMSDVLIACNQDGLIEETNAALCALVGRTEQALRGTPVLDLLADAQSVERWQLAKYHAGSHEVAVVEINLLDALGQAVPVDMNCTPRHNSSGRQVGRVLVGRPLGELNNPISFVLGNVHVLQRYGKRLTR